MSRLHLGVHPLDRVTPPEEESLADSYGALLREQGVWLDAMYEDAKLAYDACRMYAVLRKKLNIFMEKKGHL